MLNEHRSQKVLTQYLFSISGHLGFPDKNPRFFFIWVFFHAHSRFTGQQGKGEGIYLTPLYHFQTFGFRAQVANH